MTTAQTTYKVLWRPVPYGIWLMVEQAQSPHVADRIARETEKRWKGFTRVTAEPVRLMPE